MLYNEMKPVVLENIYRVVNLVDDIGAPRTAEDIEVELGINTKEGYIISYVLQERGYIIMSLVMTGGPTAPGDFQTIGSVQ